MKIATVAPAREDYRAGQIDVTVRLVVRDGAVFNSSAHPAVRLPAKRGLKLARALGVEEEVRAAMLEQARAQLEQARDRRERAARAYESALRGSHESDAAAMRALEALGEVP